MLDQASGRLDRLIARFETDPDGPRNEAATRFDLIDGLLLDVLRWPREQVRPEEHSEEGYADYVLGRPRRQLVVEAKREGITFALPPETPTIGSLQTLFELDPELKTVVQQARKYAFAFGLPYAAVANGHQLVAFIATRIDGVKPLDGRALTFHSLAAMRENFAELWNGLSRPGIEGRRLSAMLAGTGGPLPPAKASTLIPDYPGQAPVDRLVTDLSMLGDVFLVDLVEHESVTDEFLRECYLSSGALSQYASVSRNILKSRYPEPLSQDLEVEIAQARNRKGVPPDLLSDVTTASLSARPIILLGYVGVGKTMFVRHLVRVDARSALSEAIVLYVNLVREPALEELEPFIAERFIEELDTRYGHQIFDRAFARHVYLKELDDFNRGPWGELAETNHDLYVVKRAEHLAGLMSDREAHLRRSLSYLATEKHRQVVTILDNVDQRPADVQDQVFTIAESLAKSWPGTVFVSLRPDTFNRSKRSGSLAAYQPRVFAVSPPRIDLLLERRIAFAQKQLAKQALPDGLTALSNAEALRDFLEIIRLSLRRSKALAELIDNLSGQNGRRAVDLLTTLLSSPHTRPAHALRRASKGRYNIPLHEFLRALMLGDRERYDPGDSRVPNLLDISTEDGREHFLLPIIISLLRRVAEPGVTEGFVAADRVYNHCQNLGFLPEQVTWQLERGLAADVLEASPLDGSPELFRATSVGAYIEQRLLGNMTYIDEISIDTPIVDDTARAVTRDAMLTSERLIRADRFSRYLDEQWALLAGEHGFDWQVHSAALKQAIADIEKRLGDVAKKSPARPRKRRRSPG